MQIRIERLLLAIGFVLICRSATAAFSESEKLELNWLRVQAVALEHGEGVEKDAVKAYALYCEAARRGDAEAMYSLGWMYLNGRGISQDEDRALYLFRAAAESGHEYANRMAMRSAGSAGIEPECMRTKTSAEAIVQDGFSNESDPTIPKPIFDLVTRLAPEYRIQPKLALAIIRVESNFDSKALSAKSAQGLMQLIPDTAKRFNVRDPFDPEQNIRGGLAYLRWLLAYFRGYVPFVLAGYNAGEGTVDRFKGIPPFPETREYVRKVMQIFQIKEHPFEQNIVKRTGGDAPVF